MRQPDTRVFRPSGRVPNSRWPVLIYRGAATASAIALEALFRRNGWGNSWRNGIYSFHHFHSTAHEVLGIATGRVRVILGGEAGDPIDLTTGDVAVLPAGTGHKRIEASPDLLVVGAYPAGRDWDLVRADEIDAQEYEAALSRIAAVPRPATDPVVGPDGPLLRLWAQP